MFWRRSDNEGEGRTSMVILRDMREVEHEVWDAYSGHHQYDWSRPRAGWLESGCPVFIHFGEDHVWQLMRYDASGLPCVRRVAKRKLVHDAMVESEGVAIGTRFYPIG